MKYIIAGVPKAGKTSMAQQLSTVLGLPILHTDDLIKEGSWDSRIDTIVAWIADPSPGIIEGVQAIHGLRRYLGAGGKFSGTVIWLDLPVIDVTAQQANMGKGVCTIMAQIRPRLSGQVLGRGRVIKDLLGGSRGD